MNSRNRLALAAGSVLLVACAVFGYPTPAAAQTVSFKNDAGIPVTVLPGCLTPQGMRRDRPYNLDPKEATPPLTLPGKRAVIIYDGRVPGRVLYQGELPGGPNDLYLSILRDPSGTRVKLILAKP